MQMDIESFGLRVGHTPLYKVSYLLDGKKGFCYIKDESRNPSGSIKDRPAFGMLAGAKVRGEWHEGMAIAEVTSGNMGISLAMIGREVASKVTVFMPETMSEERKSMLRLLGADLSLVKTFDEAFAKSSRLDPLATYVPHQFENPDNLASYHHLVEEVVSTGIRPSGIVSGVGTGGTLSGIGRYLKDYVPSLSIIYVIPIESEGAKSGTVNHLVEGIADGFIPGLFKDVVTDKTIRIHDYDGVSMARLIREKLGFHVGISSGANLLSAILSKEDGLLSVFPDRDDRYLSGELFSQKERSAMFDRIELLEATAIS